MAGSVTDRIADIATGTTYVASGSSVIFGGLTANDIAMLGGLLLAAMTFVVNLIYRHKHYKLAKAQVERDQDG